jgi:catecholate siderophore receptor
VFKPIPSTSLYAAYGVTETPVGNELDSTGVEYNGLNAANAGLAPEETRGVEVGAKVELFNGRMLATGAAFESIKDNARTNRNLPAQGNRGEYRVRGVEFGVSGNITDRWSVFGGITWLATETLDSDLASEIGTRLANIPVTQFALLSKYKVTDKLTVGGQAIYQGEVVAGHFAENATGYRIPDYWRFDAMAEYEFNDNWSVEVSGLNLTDELYYDAIYQDPAAFAYVAPGRAGYLSVKWKY